MLVNLNEVLYDAQKNHYAVGLFNTVDTDSLEAVIEAAERKRSPVIIGTAEILLPYGELALIGPSTVEAARRASVPVVVHYDHGLTFGRCMEALKLGFSSVMYDGSVKPYAQNIEETREIVRIAHCFGATVEGEIGHVGSAVDEGDLAGTPPWKKQSSIWQIPAWMRWLWPSARRMAHTRPRPSSPLNACANFAQRLMFRWCSMAARD